MKINIYLGIFCCLLSFLSVSCDQETEMIFDQTASERKTEALEEYSALLKNSEEGWILQYFPDKDLAYGGYTYVVKFNANDSVSVWYESMEDFSQPTMSLYDVISYGGPVLSFNTYNNLMHIFATPTPSEYNAKGGDYEFRIISANEDSITIKGIKTDNKMLLTKLNEPAEDYLAKVKENVDFLSGASITFTMDEFTSKVLQDGRILTIQYMEGGEVVTVSTPYIITDEGISFYEPIEISGIVYQDFTLNKQTSRLISQDGSVYFDIINPPIKLNDATWFLNVINESNCSKTVYNAWAAAYQANSDQWGEQLGNVIVMGDVFPLYGDYGISFYSYPLPYRAHYNMAFEGVVGEPDYMNFVKVSGGFNWKWYTQLEVFVDVIAYNSPYNVEIDDKENPSVLTFTSVDNPDVWFVLGSTY